MGDGEFHKRVSFSASLPGLETMQPLFHENVVSAYVQLLAAAGQISSSDIEHSTAGGTLVDFVVTFPPNGEGIWRILCTYCMISGGFGCRKTLRKPEGELVVWEGSSVGV